MPTVYIRDLDKLTVDLKVAGIRYGLEKGEAVIVFRLEVAYEKTDYSETFSMTMGVNEKSVADVEKLIAENQAKLQNALNKVKKPIAELLKLSNVVQMELVEISEKLLDELVGIPKEGKA